LAGGGRWAGFTAKESRPTPLRTCISG